MKKTVSLALICALLVLACPVWAETSPAASPITTALPSATPDSTAAPAPDGAAKSTPVFSPAPTPLPTAAPAWQTPPPVPTLDNRLKRGSKGDEVKQMQERLRILGFLTGSADGQYGPATETAVSSLKIYMQELALLETAGLGLESFLPDMSAPADEDGKTPDAAEYSETEGIADDAVRHLLLREGFILYQMTLSRGSRGWEVSRLQNRLNTLRYLHGGTDGQFGKKTEAAVSAFQKANDLPETGVADEETQLLLYSEVAKEAPIPTKPYVLKISVADQRVYAYAYDISTGGYSKLVRTMICSTGLKDTPTPYGTFSSAGPVARWGYFPKWDVYAQYLFRITGGILFHSVLYQTSEESSLIQGSVSKLGSRASHGCVRLKVEDAKWIYNHCPAGTTVIVY